MTKLVLTFVSLSLLCLACVHGAGSGSGTSLSARKELGTEAEHATLSAPSCGRPINGAKEISRPGGLVMFGEIHGTHEAPEFVLDFACQALSLGLKVRLGLELPAAESRAIERYLDSDGLESDRVELLSGAHWQREYQDGRSSEGMTDLLERARELRAAGLPLTVFVFDVDSWTEWNQRDAAMARTILGQASTDSSALVLTLSGNLHNRTKRGLPWDPEAVPMGTTIRMARNDALSFDIRHHGGSAWLCTQEDGCGAIALSGTRGPSRTIERWLVYDEHGYNGAYWLARITSAYPAISTLARGGSDSQQ